MSPKGLSLALTTSKQQYGTGEPIDLECTLTNVSQQELLVPPRIHFLTWRFYVRMPVGGTKAVGSPLFVNEVEAMRDIKDLPPQQSLTFVERIHGEGAIFSFPKQVGTYTIYAQFENLTSHWNNQLVWTGLVESNSLVITVQESGEVSISSLEK